MGIEVALKWTDELQFVARSGGGPAVVIDSSDGKSGATPMALLLMGVAGCTAIDIVMILEKKRINLKRFDLIIHGEQATHHPMRYTGITIKYILSGSGLTPKAVEQAIRLSEEKFCSARASLNAEFESTYEIVEN